MKASMMTPAWVKGQKRLSSARSRRGSGAVKAAHRRHVRRVERQMLAAGQMPGKRLFKSLDTLYL